MRLSYLPVTYKARREAEVGDPLEALFDLAKVTQRYIPKLRAVVTFGEFGGISAGAILILALLVLISMGAIDAWVAGLIFGLSIACLFISGLSFRSETFLDFFDRRLDTISKILTWDPNPAIPNDSNPATRALMWLISSDDNWAKVLKGREVQRDACPKGCDPNFHFDIYFIRRFASPLRRAQLFIKVYNKSVGIADLRVLKEQVENICRRQRLPPRRIIAIQTANADVPENVSDWLDMYWILFPIGSLRGGEAHACPIELLVETSDRKYDIIVPYVG